MDWPNGDDVDTTTEPGKRLYQASPATQIDAADMNMYINELMNIIIDAGVTPSDSTLDQISTIIQGIKTTADQAAADVAALESSHNTDVAALQSLIDALEALISSTGATFGVGGEVSYRVLDLGVSGGPTDPLTVEVDTGISITHDILGFQITSDGDSTPAGYDAAFTYLENVFGPGSMGQSTGQAYFIVPTGESNYSLKYVKDGIGNRVNYKAFIWYKKN